MSEDNVKNAEESAEEEEELVPAPKVEESAEEEVVAPEGDS